MWQYRKALLLLALPLFLSPLCWSQSLQLNSPSIEKLQAILQRYETSIASLKSRIVELETQLAQSVATSDNLAQGFPALRQELTDLRGIASNLEADYATLKASSEAFREQLEISSKQTEISLLSLNLSVTSLKLENKILMYGGVLALALLLVDMVVSIFK